MKNIIEKAKRLILVVSGGIGRNIFATAVVKNLKLAYPDKDIFVVAGCPEIFSNNPNIKRIYSFEKPVYLFEDFIFNNADTAYLDVEPYRHPQYISNNMHIIEAWSELLEIPCIQKLGEIYLSNNEKEMAELHVKNFGKPLVLFQPIGGITPQGNDAKDKLSSKVSMYRRSLTDTVIQEVTDFLVSEGFTAGIVGSQTQFLPKGAVRICMPIRAVLSLIDSASALVGIDSFLMHGAAAFNKSMLICWGGTSPDKLGYTLHTNLRKKACSTPECHRPNSYLFDLQPNGFPWDCSHNDACMNYTSKEIIEALTPMLANKKIVTKAIEPEIVKCNLCPN